MSVDVCTEVELLLDGAPVRFERYDVSRGERKLLFRVHVPEPDATPLLARLQRRPVFRLQLVATNRYAGEVLGQFMGNDYHVLDVDVTCLGAEVERDSPPGTISLRLKQA